jgi:hypothetical protein
VLRHEEVAEHVGAERTLQLLAFQLLDRLAYEAGRRLGEASRDPRDAPAPVPDELASFLRTYASPGRKVVDPYARFLLDDPLPSLVWWLQFASWVGGGWRRLGR